MIESSEIIEALSKEAYTEVMNFGGARMKEKQAFHINGYLGLVGLVIILGIGFGQFLPAMIRIV